MGYTLVPTRAGGYAPVEADWDQFVKDNFNTGTWAKIGEGVIAGTGTQLITFSSIPATFSHLKAVGFLRGQQANLNAQFGVRLNGDSAGNYDYVDHYGSAATPFSTQTFAANVGFLGFMPCLNASAGYFGAFEATFPGYKSTVHNKVILSRWFSRGNTSSSGIINGRHGMFWRSSAAINAIEFRPASGNWADGARIALFGLG